LQLHAHVSIAYSYLLLVTDSQAKDCHLMKSLNRLHKLANTALTFSLAFYNTILNSTLLRLSVDLVLQMEMMVITSSVSIKSYKKLLNDQNKSHRNGMLVVEVIPNDQNLPTVRIPKNGDRIEVHGA
jgi:hypothetical protein